MHDYELIIDYSIIEKNLVYSIPIHHVIKPIFEYSYKLPNNPLIFYIKWLDNSSLSSINKLDFYFEYEIDLTQDKLIEYTNEFLSSVNKSLDII